MKPSKPQKPKITKKIKNQLFILKLGGINAQKPNEKT